MPQRSRSLVLLVGTLLAPPGLAAADWPTYRADACRSGFTAEILPGRLAPAWEHRLRHAPRPAWSGRDTRMGFDRGARIAVADGRLFYGSSAGGEVLALDAATGRELWAFITEGPVRLGPTAWQDRVYVPSDDGFLYCLSATGGSLIWRIRAGPRESWVLGNGRLISRWPVRGGPAVADGRLYFGSGIWPSEGVYLRALDGATGRVLWSNDTCGSLFLPQPHSGAEAWSGISAQGDLVVCGDRLLVPTGRAVPAAVARDDGRLLYFHLQRYGHNLGGAAIVGAGSEFICGNGLFDAATGELLHRGIRAEASAVTPSVIFAAQGDKVIALDRGTLWTETESVDRRGVKVTRRTLSAPVRSWPSKTPVDVLIASGDALVLGTRGRIAVADAASGETRFAAEIDGTPHDIAVSGRRLFVSTEAGAISCFAEPGAPGSAEGDPSGSAGRAGSPASAAERPSEALPDLAPAVSCAAEEILRRTGISEGHCVDLGCGDGGLAIALALRSELNVHAVERDPELVRRLRKALDRSGLLGVRVTVHDGDPADSRLPDAFADLVVSGRSVAAGPAAVPLAEALRLRRPYGGVACLGRTAALQCSVRGPLEGSGEWTHQYADAANTGCSDDQIVLGTLGVRWFADLGFPMPNRHGRGPAPLFHEGRLFVEGLDGLLCVDAYNGRRIWEHSLPGILRSYDQDHLLGTAGTGSNMCVGKEGLFVRSGGRCWRIDPATGRRLGEIVAPSALDGRPCVWAFLALAEGTLYGTLANTEHIVKWRYHKGDMRDQLTESVLLFACDPLTGAVRWTCRPERSIRHNAIAIGGGRVYVIDRAVADVDRLLPEPEARRGEEPIAPAVHSPGALVALEAATGKALWRKDEDIFGTMLVLSAAHDALLLAYQDTRFKLDSEVGGRMAGFRASDGTKLWDVREKYASRPIVSGRTIYAQPGSWDLLTGEKRGFTFGRSYGCGIPSASRSLLVFRSATLGYVDLTRPGGTQSYGGFRPGCWINAIPVGGLVLVPDATDGCTCSYLIKTSIALAPLGLPPPGPVPAGE